MGRIKAKDEVYSVKSENPVTRTEYIMHGNKWLDEALENMNNYVTPEMFGAVGDGVHDDTEAFYNAIITGKKIYADNSKTYLIDNKIDVPNSFSLVGGSYISNSSADIKEIFFVNSDGINIEMSNVTFHSYMDKDAKTFPDTVKSSNVIFYHNNGKESSLKISDSHIADCEYCLKNETGKLMAVRCKFANTMMPIFSNTTDINVSDCYIESVAKNKFYHCVYLHPYEYSKNGYFTNCEMVCNVDTSFQCYNSESVSKLIDNVYVTNCSFLKPNGDYAGAFCYNDCLINFSLSKAAVSYKGRYENCDVIIDGLVQNAKIDSSVVRFKTTYAHTGELEITNSDVIFEQTESYNVNLNSGRITIIDSSVTINQLETNIFRQTGGLIEIINCFIKRSKDCNLNIVNHIDGEFVAIDNVLDLIVSDISMISNTDYSNPTGEIYNASQCATYDVGFYEFTTYKYGQKAFVTLNSRLSAWNENEILLTFRSNVKPVFDQFITLYKTSINAMIVLKVTTDGKIIVWKSPRAETDGMLYGSFEIVVR